MWQFPNLTLTWSLNLVNSYAFDFGSGKPARRLGMYFHGTNGTLYADYGTHKIVPEGDRLTDLSPPKKSIPSSPGHEREWLDCMRTRQQPSCSVDYQYRIDLALNLANLSMRIGRDIEIDTDTGAVMGDREAAKLAQPEYRLPWKFPTQCIEA